MCEDCLKHKCTGGYNCKWGACIPEILICYDDLNYGNCNKDETNCKHIHLTDLKLKPYYTTNKSNFNNLNNNLNCLNNSKYISGTLLTEDFFLHLNNVNHYSVANGLTKREDNTLIQDYSSSEEDLECDKSIFCKN